MLLEVLKHTAQVNVSDLYITRDIETHTQVNVSDLYITRGIETHSTGKCI